MQASSTRALIWLGCQGALAAARLAYWIFDPKFDDSPVVDSEIAKLNNTGSDTLTLPEVICNFTSDSHALDLPWWAVKYLLTRPLKNVLFEAASRAENNTIPLDANVHVLKGLDLGRLISRRWIEIDDDGAHMIVLTLHHKRDGSVIPYILIHVKYAILARNVEMPRFCFAEAQWPNRLSGAGVRSTCTLFAVDQEPGVRLHLRSRQKQWTCDDICLWRKQHSDNRESQNTWKYIGDRSRVCRFLKRIAEDESFDTKFTPSWERAVHVEGSNAKPKSRRGEKQPWVLDYEAGIQEVKAYLGEGFLEEKQRRRRRIFFWYDWWRIISSAFGWRGSRKASVGDSIEVPAEDEEKPPASNV